MTETGPRSVDILCGVRSCSHHKAEIGRCGLIWPGLLNDTKWIFAVPDCPIAKRFGDLTEKEIGDAPSFANLPGRAAKVLRIAELDRSAPPDRVIDHVVRSLAGDAGATERAASRLRDILDESAMTIEKHRSPPVVRAFWATCIFVLALFILGKMFGKADRLPEGAPIVASCTLSRSLAGVEPGAEFSISLTLRERAYVGVIVRPLDGRPERIFPPLGNPPGVDWPLAPHPADPANAVEIPGAGRFRLPMSGKGSVIVVWDRERFVDPTDAITAMKDLDDAAVARRLGDARIFPYEVKTP
jgi:hypothetical protein